MRKNRQAKGDRSYSPAEVKRLLKAADDTMTVHVDGNGRFTKVEGTAGYRD